MCLVSESEDLLFGREILISLNQFHFVLACPFGFSYSKSVLKIDRSSHEVNRFCCPQGHRAKAESND